MGSLFRILMRIPIFRPAVRLLIGAITIPLFRLFLRKVIRLQDLDAEIEKDLEQWFSCSLVLLVSTAFMERLFFDWLDVAWTDLLNKDSGQLDPFVTGFRILLAIGVIEAMPDQELFAIVHPGPPKLKFTRKRSLWTQISEQWRPYLKGQFNQHINRSSPVFAILAAVLPGKAGVICFFIAITQYLFIGLITSKDKAVDMLGQFDRQVALRRREIIEEFELSRGTPNRDKSDSDGKTIRRDEAACPSEKPPEKPLPPEGRSERGDKVTG